MSAASSSCRAAGTAHMIHILGMPHAIFRSQNIVNFNSELITIYLSDKFIFDMPFIEVEIRKIY